MTLTELLNNISETKALMKSKLGTSSNSLNQYPTLITNFLYTQYNDGYKAGWKSVKGTSYSGNKRQLQDVPSATVPTSWQGQDTTQLSTLVNVMRGIREIREQMRDALGIQYEDGCNVFSYYPNYLNVTSSHNSTSRADQEYQLGYTAGRQDANSTTPQRVSTPIIRVTSTNVRNISSSNATSLRYWTSYTSGGQPIGTATTIAAASHDYQIKQSDDGTYLCAIGMAANMVNSYIASAYLSYVGTIPVNPPTVIPNVPEVEIDTIENKIYITSEQDVIIKYTTNGGTSWQSNGSNTVTVSIRPIGIAAGNLQTYCYFPDNPSNPSSTWTNPNRIEYTLNIEPDEPVEDMSAVPFYIIGTRSNSLSQYTIKATSNRFHVSTTADFSSIVSPSTGTTDTWTLQTNTKYYIKKHFSSTDVPSNCSFKLGDSSLTSISISFGGNLLSLVDYNWENSSLTELPYGTSGCFRSMFTDSNWKNSIKDISKLYFPAIATGNYGYAQMFMGCTQLTDGPTSIASTIGERGCYEMFSGCTKLTKTGNILSTSIGTNGCYNMFYGCSALTNAGNIAATTVGSGGCQNMFYHCSNLKTGPSELKPLLLTSNCYYQMFDTCSKLVNAPKILATDISASQCMKWMFWQCAALKSISVCFTNWPTTSSQTGSWCGGDSFSKSGTFTIEGRGLWNISDHRGVSGIPDDWEWIDSRGIEFEPSHPDINI